MTIRGGGNPHSAMAAMPLREWTRRLGALPAEAYDCFMVGTRTGSTEYKRGSRDWPARRRDRGNGCGRACRRPCARRRYSTPGTFGEFLRDMRPIIMRCEL